jgi:hypothetical protein
MKLFRFGFVRRGAEPVSDIERIRADMQEFGGEGGV